MIFGGGADGDHLGRCAFEVRDCFTDHWSAGGFGLHGGEPNVFELVFVGADRRCGGVHCLNGFLRNDVYGEDARLFDVGERVLPAQCDRCDDERWRVHRHDVEERIRREVAYAVLRDGADPADWSWNGETGPELVGTDGVEFCDVEGLFGFERSGCHVPSLVSGDRRGQTRDGRRGEFDSMRIARRVLGWGTVVFMALAGLWLIVVFVQVSNAAGAAQVASAQGDSIVVLGAAQYNGEPSPVLESRLDTALVLWGDGAAERIVTTGANQPGDTFTEGFAAFRYLRNEGVQEADIVVVTDGGDTYESLLAAANQLPDGQETVVIVTDAYHARRSAEIAAEVGLTAEVVASSDDTSISRRLRETAAVAIGRIVSFRRLSAWR